MPCPISLAFLAGFTLSSTAQCRPYYVTSGCPPLIPPPRDSGGAVRFFPILKHADLKAQLKDTSHDTVDTVDNPLDVAHEIIEEQSSQILLLDELVRQLQVEKQALEDELSQYHSLGVTDPNPAVVMSPPRAVTSATAAAPTRHVDPSTIPITPTRRANHSVTTVTPTRHSILLTIPTSPAHTMTSRSRGTTPITAAASSLSNTTSHTRLAATSRIPPATQASSISRLSLSSTQGSHSRTPTQFAHPRNIIPLRTLGQATIDILEMLGTPDHYHDTICELVETTLPSKWESSLLQLGVFDANEVCEVIKAMESDICCPSG